MFKMSSAENLDSDSLMLYRLLIWKQSPTCTVGCARSRSAAGPPSQQPATGHGGHGGRQAATQNSQLGQGPAHSQGRFGPARIVSAHGQGQGQGGAPWHTGCARPRHGDRRAVHSSRLSSVCARARARATPRPSPACSVWHEQQHSCSVSACSVLSFARASTVEPVTDEVLRASGRGWPWARSMNTTSRSFWAMMRCRSTQRERKQHA